MNPLTIGLSQNEEYEALIGGALNRAFSQNHPYVIDKLNQENYRELCWIEKGRDLSLLFFNHAMYFSICYQDSSFYTKDSFAAQLEMAKKGEVFLPQAVLAGVFVSPENKASHPESKDFIEKHLGFRIIKSTASRQVLNRFHEELVAKGYLEAPVPQAVLDKTEQLITESKFIQEDVAAIIPHLVKLRQLAQEMNIHSKNKHVFNDGDAAFWLPELQNGVCFKGQSMSFIATSRHSDQDWQIFSFAGDDSIYKTQHSIIEAMIAGNAHQAEAALLVQNGRPVYVGDTFECMQQDVEYSLEEAQSRVSCQKRKKKM